MAVSLVAKTITGGHASAFLRPITITGGSTIGLAFIEADDSTASPTIVSVLLNGSAMSLLGSTGKVNGDGTAGGDNFYYVYWIANPTTGNLVITYTGTTDNVYCNFYEFAGSVTSSPSINISTIGAATETATLTASGGEYGVGLAGSGFALPTGFSLTGDASSNQGALNLWFTGDTNGTVASGSRTAISNHTSGTSQNVAIIVLVSPPAAATTTRDARYLPLMGVG